MRIAPIPGPAPVLITGGGPVVTVVPAAGKRPLTFGLFIGSVMLVAFEFRIELSMTIL